MAKGEPFGHARAALERSSAERNACRVTVASSGSTYYRIHSGANCTGEDRGTFYIHGEVTEAARERMHDMLVIASSAGMRLTIDYVSFSTLAKYITELQLHAS